MDDPHRPWTTKTNIAALDETPSALAGSLPSPSSAPSSRIRITKMGRWTNEYQDDVLTSKLKGLVSGAITRSKLEKAEPTISYKNFVEDLDAGDSFTTSVIEILVQELAERRLRSSPGDRRLIADRTAKSLRLLATPIRIYRERRTAGRRTVNMAEYLTAPPDEMDLEEDEDEFDSLLDRASQPVEGVRMNSELYDAYGPPSWTSPRRSLPIAGPPTPTLSDGPPTPPLVLSPPRTSTVWTLPPAAPGSLALSRQPSIRRPTRSRTVDFNEFTAQRRSSTRDLRADAPAGDDTWSRSRSTRRFFPFSYQTRRHDLSWNESLGEGSGELSDDPLNLPEPTPSSTTFYSFPTPISSSSSSHDGHPAETSQVRVTSSGPRLRRGGVRPPESLLLRRVSPTRDGGAPQSPVSEGALAYPAPADAPSYPVPDAASYPTPGSPANESGSENQA
ncbi:hypothetical protein B0H16DRAFT_1565705 [Mycena metata]|uniref:Uncharacterized protein n=1 Tax=Mycena metata TaxID=1033252 RepID=A0AAD7IFS3_9AGAR|nr:hypothetical protein B0H16DRAFT_1565705 [Mycena metata]